MAWTDPPTKKEWVVGTVLVTIAIAAMILLAPLF